MKCEECGIKIPEMPEDSCESERLCPGCNIEIERACEEATERLPGGPSDPRAKQDVIDRNIEAARDDIKTSKN